MLSTADRKVTGMKPSTAKPSAAFQHAVTKFAEKLRELEGDEESRRLIFTVHLDDGVISGVESEPKWRIKRNLSVKEVEE